VSDILCESINKNRPKIIESSDTEMRSQAILVSPVSSYTVLQGVDGQWVIRVTDEAILELQVLNTRVFDLDDECYWTWEVIEPALTHWGLLQDIPGVIQIVDAWIQQGLSPEAFENAEGSIALLHATPPDITYLQDVKFRSAMHLTQVLGAFSRIIESIHSVGKGHGGLSEKVLLLSTKEGACIRFESDRYLSWDPMRRSFFSPEQEIAPAAAADVYAFARIVWGILTDPARILDDRLRRDMLGSSAKTLYKATSLRWSDRGFLSTRELLDQLAKDWEVYVPPTN
jgi:hypothetical protein